MSIFVWLLISLVCCEGLMAESAPVFTKDIAPILFRYCSPCHRPGQPAPFSLIRYSDVAKRRDQIADVIRSRTMPPWLPARQKHHFANERRLTEQEINTIETWVLKGAPEGDPHDLPEAPKWVEGWSLGRPDLILTLPEPYQLSAEGEDTYRNFVLPIPITNRQQVVAVEFRPGNGRVVHHAFIRLDATRGSRTRDAEDAEPGFSGLHAPGTMPPEGFFSSWQPGKMTQPYPQGLSWTLKPGEDLVVQVHLRHSGKVEKVQPQVGFYFTNQPPKSAPLKLYLQSTSIAIPAGASNYLVRDKIQIPVDVALIGILPHAHYLAKSVTVNAILPGGRIDQLLEIPRWDFNWQGDYAYEQPVFIPRGSSIEMNWVYDNTSANPNNPSKPPKWVNYGLQSTDEMAEVWLQVLVRSKSDYDRLNAQVAKRLVTDTISYNEFILKTDPQNSTAWFELGKGLALKGELERAESAFAKSLAIKQTAEVHFHLGLVEEMQKKPREAQKEYEAALRLNPDNYLAHNNLGLLLLETNDFSGAVTHFREAVRFSGGDTMPLENLELALAKQRSAVK